MALFFMDGFDSFGATADIATKWASNSKWVYHATNGKYGGKCIQYTADGQATPYFSLPKGAFPGGNEVYMAFWFKASAQPSSPSPQNTNFIHFNDSNGSFSGAGTARTSQIGFWTGGVLAARYWREASGLYSVVGGVNVCDNTFHWIELKYKMATSGGFLQIKIDGVTDINISGAATAVTADPTIVGIYLSNPALGSGSPIYTIDDMVIWDDTGSGLMAANYPIGPQKIITLLPNGDTADKDFSRSTGSDNYALVDESAINSDTDYVESAINGDLDLYDFGALGVTPTGVTCVVASACVKNPEGGSINTKLTAKSSSTTAQSAAKAVGVSYKHVQHAFMVDPDTSAAWTESGINAAKFGLEVST